MKKKNEVKKVDDESTTSREEKILDLDILMTVEGGADNDDDWCAVSQIPMCYVMA